MIKAKVDAQWIEITKFSRNLTGIVIVQNHRPQVLHLSRIVICVY